MRRRQLQLLPAVRHGRTGAMLDKRKVDSSRTSRAVCCYNRSSRYQHRDPSLFLTGEYSSRKPLTLANLSLLAQDAETLLGYGTSPIGSRLLDAVLEAPSVPMKYKRKLMIAFVSHYTTLATDRIGSRVVERLWDGADLYLKVSPSALIL